MDKLTPDRRSANMSRIRACDTEPELRVRRFLHARGLRYRLRGSLPGKPDLIFSRHNICVFVHGCFWHGCPNCVDGTRRVKSNASYWTKKIEGNQARDRRILPELLAMGWTPLIIWECETRNPDNLRHLAEMIRREREKN